MRSIYENLGGTYKANGDYSLSTLALPQEEQIEIGVWGQRYRRHLKENHRIIYYNYLTKGTVNVCINDSYIIAVCKFFTFTQLTFNRFFTLIVT